MKTMRVGCCVLLLFVGTFWGAEQATGGVESADRMVKFYLAQISSQPLLLDSFYSESRDLDAESSIAIAPALLRLLNDEMKADKMPEVLTIHFRRSKLEMLFSGLDHRDPANQLPYLLPDFLNLSSKFPPPRRDPGEDDLWGFSVELISILTKLKKENPLLPLADDITCLEGFPKDLLRMIDDFVGLDEQYLELWTKQFKTIENEYFRKRVRCLLRDQSGRFI